MVKPGTHNLSTHHPAAGLRVKELKTTRDRHTGQLYVVGSILNTSEQTVHDLWVNYESLDRSSAGVTLLEAGIINIQPTTLEPGQVGSFQAPLTRRGQVVRVTSVETLDRLPTS